VALDERRTAVAEAERARDEAAALAANAAAEHARAQQAIEAAEQDVEQARGEVYAVMNTVTALTAALQAATSQRERAQEALNRLHVEAADLQTEQDRANTAHAAASASLHSAQESLEGVRLLRLTRESELATARNEHEWRARDLRTREHELASLGARLRSLEELDAHRAGFSDAARMVLAQANGHVGQMGALADFIEVDSRYERAVEAHLGDLLQHVLVRGHEHAAAGLTLVRREEAGRCGFIIVGDPIGQGSAPEDAPIAAANTPQTGDVMSPTAGTGTRLSSVVRIASEHAAAIRDAIGDALIVESFDEARDLAAVSALPVATLDGDVLRGQHLVTGGAQAEARGILATKREIKALRERVTRERDSLDRLGAETAQFEHTIVQATAAIASLSAELHRQEKAIVTFEAQLQRATEEQSRIAQRSALVSSETSRVDEEIGALDLRQTEARESIARLDDDKRAAEAALTEAQRVLQAARDQSDLLAQHAAEARANHAALVERSSASAADVRRLESAARELEHRVETCHGDLTLMRQQRERLLAAVVDAQRGMDLDVAALEELRAVMRESDDKALALKTATEQQETIIRDARRALDALRALTAELDVSRATAEADLAHLAQQCADSVGASLDEVRDEVERMEIAGEVEPDANAIRQVESAEPDEEEELSAADGDVAAIPDAAPVRMTAEEAIAELRDKIDKLGPVNMMAIEQFTELETRHTFLTTQRKDLVDSIAQTNEAIKRIDETTHARFRDAFTAINTNFQQTFSTLFGGGRAGITLLDENDPLESGIDIVASPPGKRLQNVMLLSGGEKALTAIALMFAIFKYKPSPFCLLDEIDAPLDDANIGRFVEMLRAMLDRTQFIIITHNRKTMEIANRLYGVTMEEPGVSKLISIQLN
jgi:chromosome segregation protein